MTLGLYIHIPFCETKCPYCDFNTYAGIDSLIPDYVAALRAELGRWGRLLGHPRVSTVFFGGGTPSYLSVEQLRTLTDGLRRCMSWDDTEEITFECEPGTLNRKKLEAIRDFGVTRLSLGIENFDDKILEINNRAHLSKQVFAAYEDARATGFDQINIDLTLPKTSAADLGVLAKRPIANAAFAMALEQAGVALDDIDFAEVHDCFTIAELLTYEAMGLAPKGQGARAIEDGSVYRDGRLPVNLSGGLKAKGHPVGATGVSMHAIAYRQLTGQAGELQLPNAKLGLIFNMGGAAVANYVSVLEA